MLVCLLAASPGWAQDVAADTGGVTGAQVRKAIGQAGANDDQSGLSLPLGIAVDAGGDGQMRDGAELAVAQIKAAGGPDFRLIAVDVGRPGAWTGDKAVAALLAAGAPVVLTAGGAAGGTMLDGLAADHILGLDGDIGVPEGARGKPFFWGMRAAQPIDDFPVGLSYWATTSPRIHRVSLVYQDRGRGDPVSAFRAALADNGMQLASASSFGTGSDAASAIAAIRAGRPDAIYLDLNNAAPFLDQLAAAGISEPVIGSGPVTAPAVQRDYIFATDLFDAGGATNDWATLFVRSFHQRFGIDPQTGAANAYEDVFAVWTLIRRVRARGGDIHSGARLQQELLANHAFKSIYGGDGNALDDIVLDPASHSVLERSFGIYRYRDGALRMLARSDMGGANLQLTVH